MNDVVMLTPTQVAALLGVGTQTLLNWQRKGYGPPVTGEGKHRRYPSDEFQAWREERARAVAELNGAAR